MKAQKVELEIELQEGTMTQQFQQLTEVLVALEGNAEVKRVTFVKDNEKVMRDPKDETPESPDDWWVPRRERPWPPMRPMWDVILGDKQSNAHSLGEYIAKELKRIDERNKPSE
jgi:hypothetical protein